MAYNVSRLTLYAIISAVEEDLRKTILTSAESTTPLRDTLGFELYEKAEARLTKDVGKPKRELELVDLVPYIDFADSFELLNRNRRLLSESQAKELKFLTHLLSDLVPIRNRVAHTRPLNYDDLAVTLDAAGKFTEKEVFPWHNLRSVLERLREDPSFVLGLTIPFYDTYESDVSHNLPTPDFDETGFLGREGLVKKLIELCRGPYPVISILGEGGIGKTALALKTAYELLDQEENQFDAIVWTSSKTNQLSVQEISRIENAIIDSLGMFHSVASELAGDVDIHQPLDELLEYLSEFRILLVLDNLETVLDDRVRSFLSRLPLGSKVLLTSRIGVGAFEFPVKIEPLSENEGIQLIRALAKVRGVDRILAVPNKRLADYCRRMNFNPGYIKWFVSAIQSGKRPEEILNSSGVFLDFCMSNVYEYISPGGKNLLRAMLCVPGRNSQAELSYLTEFDALSLQQAIHELLRTNFVIMTSVATGSSIETHYELTEMSRRYLSKRHPASNDEYEKINGRKRQMIAARERFVADQEQNPYSFYSLSVRSKSDIIIAKFLSDSLKAAKRADYEQAETLVEEARKLAPEYYEIYRVDAIIQTQMGNLTAASNLYETALDLESESAPLRKWYGDFLLKYLDDASLALEQFEKAHKLDPKSIEVQIDLALANMYLKRFNISLDLLAPLVSQEIETDFWNYRKVYDIYLECVRREAEAFAEQRSIERALERIEALLEAFRCCPPEIVDVKMREKLAKASNLAISCARREAGTEYEKRADSLAAELYRESSLEKNVASTDGQTPQSGEIQTILQGYAFIRVNPRTRIFVHRSDFTDQNAWKALTVGSNVLFFIGKDEQGRDKAIQVTVTS